MHQRNSSWHNVLHECIAVQSTVENGRVPQWLREAGCPVEGLRFDPDLVTRGLIVDKALGNLLKARAHPCHTSCCRV